MNPNKCPLETAMQDNNYPFDSVDNNPVTLTPKHSIYFLYIFWKPVVWFINQIVIIYCKLFGCIYESVENITNVMQVSSDHNTLYFEIEFSY